MQFFYAQFFSFFLSSYVSVLLVPRSRKMRECVFFSFFLCLCSMPKLVLFGQRQCWWHKQVFLCLSVSVKEMHIRYSFTKERRSEKKSKKKTKKNKFLFGTTAPQKQTYFFCLCFLFFFCFFSALFSKYFLVIYVGCRCLCTKRFCIYYYFSLYVLVVVVVAAPKRGQKKCIKTLHRILLSWAASKNFYGVPFIVYCCYFCVVGVQEIRS